MESKATEGASVILRSMEGKDFKVSRGVALMSALVKNMLEGSDESEEINAPLPLVKNDILEKVIEFCVQHEKSPTAEIDKPIKSSNMSENVDEWDVKFIDQPQDIIFELILAANYMDIKSLLDLSCAKVASLIKGKTPEEIRRTFNIVNDFTPEEEAKVRQENMWCDDT